MIGMFCLSTFSYTSTRVIKQHFNSSALCLCPLSPVMAPFISLPLFWLHCSGFCGLRCTDLHGLSFLHTFFFQLFFSAGRSHTQTFLSLL